MISNFKSKTSKTKIWLGTLMNTTPNNLPLIFTIISCLMVSVTIAAAERYEPDSQSIIEIGSDTNISKLTPFRASTKLTETPTGWGIDVTVEEENDGAGIRLDVGKAFSLEQINDVDVLCITVSNPEKMDITVYLEIDHDNTSGKAQVGTGVMPLKPGEKKSFIMNFTESIFPGMRGQPRHIYGRRNAVIVNIRKLDRRNIKGFRVFTNKLPTLRTVRIHAIDALTIDAQKVLPFVDRFGQYKVEDWPGKLYSTKEFAQRLFAEEAELEAKPSLPGRSRYGGWANGPRFKATGRFRVQKHNGKWWFIDPEGYLFWSSGVTGIVAGSGGPTKGKDHFFEWLPAEGDPLAQFYEKGKEVDFFKMNLYRKYGSDFENRFVDISTRRMKSWGFNTIGNWSDKATWKLRRVPYTIPIHYERDFVLFPGSQKQKRFPDVFSQSFPNALSASLSEVAEFKDDPWLLGVFIDNELSWNPVLAIAIIQADGIIETKKHVVKFLKNKYSSIDDLNAAWKTTIKDWDSLTNGVGLNAAQRKSAEDDLVDICGFVAAQYYKVCREQMNKIMPGCLYFGSRFNSFLEPVVSEAAKHCDAVSFNIYGYKPVKKQSAELAMKYDFPIIIGEYHFGALDRGMFHTGLRAAKNQEDRAELFEAYFKLASESSWCVGAHWFQFRDQALTGRGDGENYNIGMVTITDTPYPEMINTARKINADFYERRIGLE